MPPLSSQERPAPAKASGGRRLAAWVFALAGLAALGFSAWQGRQRYLQEHPPPLPDVIAPIPPGKQEMLRKGMRFVAKTVLKATPEQEKQLAEIWQHTPRSLDEVIEQQKKTDRLLTPEQRARLKPLRKTFQDQIVDEMLEPARDRFGAADFEKLKTEIKARVDRRIEGP